VNSKFATLTVRRMRNFFPDTDDETSRRSWGTHAPPPIPFEKTLFSDFGASGSRTSKIQGPTLVLIWWCDKWLDEPVKSPSRIDSASEKVFARFSCNFLACSSISEICVFGWTKGELWPWHYPAPTSFSRYKQSRSSKGSTQKMGIYKERFCHQRRRAFQ